MVKAIDNIKVWAKENVQLITILPENTTLKVDTRLKDVLETSVDEKYYLSDEKTALLVAKLEEKAVSGDSFILDTKPKDAFRIYKELCPTLQANDYKEPKQVVEQSPIMLGHIDLKGHDAIKRVYDPSAISPTLTTMGGGHREPKIAEYQMDSPRCRIRKLTPLECFRLQGYADWMHGEAAEVNSNSQLYKQAGNSVTVNVIHEIAKRL